MRRFVSVFLILSFMLLFVTPLISNVYAKWWWGVLPIIWDWWNDDGGSGIWMPEWIRCCHTNPNDGITEEMCATGNYYKLVCAVGNQTSCTPEPCQWR